jgi:ferric-dicitrate binding protein FerR (iron transport regulator)
MSEPMDPFDNDLEARLARLEAGEPLDLALAGLPPDQAQLLRTADQMRGLPPSQPQPDKVEAQRRQYLRAAAALRAPARRETPRRAAWLAPGLALAGMAALVVCVFVPLALAALAWLRGPVGEGRPVALATPGTGLPATPGVSATALALRPPDAGSAMLQEAGGLVEFQTGEGAWQAVRAGQVLRAGQRLRTAQLSSATLGFYDGSQAQLGAGSELSIDELDARAAGARVVSLTQWMGESAHAVAHADDPGSRYSVNTPNGMGTAKGTRFHVQVTRALLVRFDVDEGVVDVTHQQETVQVVAGQATIVTADAPPSAPAFLISGEGQVQAIGETWQIAGRDFVTHPNTVVYGDPQVGDWVRFDGRVIADGLRVLDKIVLLRRAANNRFSLVGQVDSIGATEWVIAGRVVRVDGETELAPGLALGAWVEVTGGIGADGAWWASRIVPLNAPGELTFRFAGTVQTQSPTVWTVSGITLTVDADTEIESGIVVGDAVLVDGRLLDDGDWLAEHIRRLLPGDGMFEIIGALDGLDPLTVDGLRLVTAAWTDIDEGLSVGDRVRATGRILDDGTWLAERVERLDDATTPFEFVGVIQSMASWLVAGVPLSTTAETDIDAGLAVGDLVRVRGEIRPDGTWLAHSIRRVDDGQGCLVLRNVVVRIEGTQIVLLDGQVIDLNGVTVNGTLNPGAVIVVYGCVGDDGQLLVIAIVIVFQLPEPPATPTPGPTPTPVPTRPPEQSDKVTICHRPPGNPGNAHTITVGAPAVPAHLGHGDTLGPCP